MNAYAEICATLVFYVALSLATVTATALLVFGLSLLVSSLATLGAGIRARLRDRYQSSR